MAWRCASTAAMHLKRSPSEVGVDLRLQEAHEPGAAGPRRIRGPAVARVTCATPASRDAGALRRQLGAQPRVQTFDDFHRTLLRVAGLAAREQRGVVAPQPNRATVMPKPWRWLIKDVANRPVRAVHPRSAAGAGAQPHPSRARASPSGWAARSRANGSQQRGPQTAADVMGPRHAVSGSDTSGRHDCC